MTIGEKIRFHRESQGLTRLQLQELSGVKEITIKQYELGNRNPKKEYVYKIAKALGIQYTDLDEEMEEQVARWNSQLDVQSIATESKMFDGLPNYDQDDIETFKDFLTLNPEGKQKVSGYIQDLLPTYKQN